MAMLACLDGLLGVAPRLEVEATPDGLRVVEPGHPYAQLFPKGSVIIVSFGGVPFGRAEVIRARPIVLRWIGPTFEATPELLH